MPSTKPSLTWPTPRIRDHAPVVVTVLAVAHLMVTAVVHHRYGLDEDRVATWVVAPTVSAAAATVLWVLLATRLDPGAPGWKRVPRWVDVDPASRPRRSLRWRWLLWYVPSWAVVTTAALLTAPVSGYAGRSAEDVAASVAVTAFLQGFAALLTVLAVGLLLLPLVLVGVGLHRLDDGEGLPPTGPVLLATGMALLVTPLVAVSVVLAGAADAPTAWGLAALASVAVLVTSLVVLVGYGVHVRDRAAT